MRTSLASVVCHPHPLFGGTLHNKVIYQTAKSLDALGLPVLRFNFRGAGLSEGTHDRGRGELGDVKAALDFLAGEIPGVPLLVAGFSFGCWVGLRVACEDERVTEMIGLGTPVNNADFSYLERCSKPKLFVSGDHDQFGPRPQLERVVESAPEPKKLVIIESTDHFFEGRLREVRETIESWTRTVIGA